MAQSSNRTNGRTLLGVSVRSHLGTLACTPGPSFLVGPSGRGMVFVAVALLISSTPLSSCRRTTDPRQLAAVDDLITSMEAARLTLNELDTLHYSTADSILRATRSQFLLRFSDTLGKATATTLGNQFIALREAGLRATDHRNVVSAVRDEALRLTQLRNDMNAGALNREETAKAIVNETAASAVIEHRVIQVITNHQATQRVLELQTTVDSLLADTIDHRRTR